MDDFHTPIFAQTYALAKRLYELRSFVPKQDRHGIWQRCEAASLDVLQSVMAAERLPSAQKAFHLETASGRLDVLRILVRLAKDCRAIDLRRYAAIQENIDEVGRMLGGWLKSVRQR